MVRLQRCILLCLTVAIGGSLSLASEKWPHFFTAQVEYGHDSNVSGLNPDVAGINSTEPFDVWLEGDLARRWARDNSRVWEVAFGGNSWKREHGEEPFALETRAWYARAEFDLPEKFAKRLLFERLTFGAQFEDQWVHLTGRSFADSKKLTLGFQGTWVADGKCNLDNVLLYYEREDFDDGPVANPALSRSGVHESWGVDFNLYGKAVEWPNCRRTSIFRRYWPSGTTNLTFGYRNDDIQSASEFASRWNRFYFDGRFPLRVGQDNSKSKWSVDASVGVALVKYDNPSIFPPFIAREDTPRYMEAALVKHFRPKKRPVLDLRIGYRWETNAASDIERYAYERNYYFIGLVFEHYDERDDYRADDGNILAGSGGSSSGRRGGLSGSSDPVNPTP